MSFRVCMIGCGGHSRKVHGPSLRKYAHLHDDTELVACCDLDDEKAARYQEEFGFQKRYNDLEQMLAAEKPDAVCVVMHVDYTCKVACQVMELGYPVLLEKPPGMTADEVDSLIATAERTGVPNMVAFNRRHTPTICALRERLDAFGAPGDIQHLRYDFTRYRRRDPDFSTTAIHGIDAVRYLMASDYKTIDFTYRPFPEHGENVANILMMCTMESGATAHLEFCPIAGLIIERATVQAWDNTWYLKIPMWNGIDAPGSLLHIREREVAEELDGATINDGDEMFEMCGFYGENAAFIDALKAGRKPSPSLAESRQSVEVMQALRERATRYEKV